MFVQDNYDRFCQVIYSINYVHPVPPPSGFIAWLRFNAIPVDAPYVKGKHFFS